MPRTGRGRRDHGPCPICGAGGFTEWAHLLVAVTQPTVVDAANRGALPVAGAPVGRGRRRPGGGRGAGGAGSRRPRYLRGPSPPPPPVRHRAGSRRRGKGAGGRLWPQAAATNSCVCVHILFHTFPPLHERRPARPRRNTQWRVFGHEPYRPPRIRSRALPLVQRAPNAPRTTPRLSNRCSVDSFSML